MNRDRRKRAHAGSSPAPVTPAPTRQILALMRDPLRLAIVTRLLFEPASAAEIAADLDLPVEGVRHQLRKLSRSGIVERRGRTRRRGVTEYLYGCDGRRNQIRPGGLAGLPPGLHDEGQLRLLAQMFRETMAAIDTGAFTRRDDFALVRFPLPLDEPGWEEVRTLSDDLVDSILEVSMRTAARIQGSDTETLPCLAAVLLFEAPSTPWPTPIDVDAESPRSGQRASRRHPVDAIGTMADPLRIKIVDALVIGPRSAGEIASLVAVPVAKVRYELKGLRRAGLVTVQEKRSRRGTIEHIYACEMEKLFAGSEEIAHYDRRRLSKFCRQTVSSIFREALDATRAGAFHDRDDFCLARIPMRLDDQGFSEAAATINSTLTRLIELRRRCLKRLQVDGAPAPRPAFSDLLLFEAAPWR